MREMKDSGVEWIGEIPNDWNTCHLKYICNFRTGGTPANKFGIDSINCGYPWITPQDITDSMHIEKYTQYISQEAIKQFGYQLFPSGSILLVCIASVGKVGIISENCYSNQQITALISNEANIVSKYALYYIKAASVKISFDASSNVVPIINTSYLKRFYCTVPPLSEQHRIANFLDSKCAEIDALTADIQSQIDTLEQYKRSLITETVTKGLNPDVEMKDSGVEWIGEIPKHWSVIRIKYLADLNQENSFVDGDWIESTDIDESGIRYLTTGNIGDGKFKHQGNGYITEETFYRLNCKYAYPGDLTIARLNAPYGRSCILPNDFEKYVLAVDIVILRATSSSKFLCYVTQCNGYQRAVEDKSSGTTMKRVSRINLGNVFVPIPPLPEQKQIANFLDSKCAEIDNIIETKTQQIEALGEYKKSLIYEYVTGKKEVPEI